MTRTAISFDLWGTVLQFGDRTAAAAWRLAEFDRVLAAFGHHRDHTRLAAATRDTGERLAYRQRHYGEQPTADQQLAPILAALDVPSDPSLLHALATVHQHANLRACPEPVEHAAAVLDNLRAAGHLLVLASNTLTCPGAVTRRILDGNDLTRRFDRLFFSDELGVAKPHPGFFAAITADVSDRVLHVGDDWRTDVCGATAAGWDAIWLNSTSKPAPAGPTPTAPVRKISALTVLPDLIGQGTGASVVPAPRTSPEVTPEAGRR